MFRPWTGPLSVAMLLSEPQRAQKQPVQRVEQLAPPPLAQQELQLQLQEQEPLPALQLVPPVLGVPLPPPAQWECP